MAMKKLQHGSHECVLTSPEIVTNGICNICYKDESCSNLPQRVSHEFHSKHPLEPCLRKYDQKRGHITCSGCGNMSSESFYECKDSEIYLDLDCAILSNIFRSWDAKEKFHYSHAHLLKRCRPGPDAKGSCLLCELPLSPSAVCYGCAPCYSFVHERCLDSSPIEIQHPLHPPHPLRRLDYTHNCGSGISCDGCGNKIVTVPIGCLECRFHLHVKCADSLLRGLIHKSHEHRLFYRASDDDADVYEHDSCEICNREVVTSLGSNYHCVECRQDIHFECLEIPTFVVKKLFHIHPLVCEIFLPEYDSLEYCGVCETMMHVGNHAYSCKECDFLGHIECILRKEPPSPLYLKELARGTDQEECATGKLEKKTNGE